MVSASDCGVRGLRFERGLSLSTAVSLSNEITKRMLIVNKLCEPSITAIFRQDRIVLKIDFVRIGYRQV